MTSAAPRSGCPRVSVILPVRDEEAFLPEALASLSSQTEQSFEILAIDDGSRDKTSQILDNHPDPRLRVLRQPPTGIVAALNHGLAQARAPYVARMDADDLAAPERLGLQAAFLDANPGVGLLASRVEYLGDRDASRGLALWLEWTNSLLTPAAIACERFVESPLVHPSVMFRRTLIEQHGGYRDGDFPEDYELWLRWLEAGVAMTKLDAPLLRWRDRPDRLTRTDPRYSVDAFFRTKAPFLSNWLARHNPHHPDVVIWGAGRVTRRRLAPVLAQGLAVQAWVDIDPKKIGWNIEGAPVIAPSSLPPPGGAFVLVAVGKRGARSLIESELRRQGYTPGIDYLFCA